MTRSNYRLIGWLGCLLACLPGSASADNDIWSMGPLWDQFPLTLDPGKRTEALGPIFYHQTKDTERTTAFPPFYSRCVDDVTDFEEQDFLYPLLTYDRFGTEHRWQFIQLLSFAG